MSSLGTNLFGYIFPSNRMGMDYALERLTVDHFRKPSDAVYRTFWQVLAHYGERYGDVFPGEYLEKLLVSRKIEPSKILLFKEQYQRFVEVDVAESAFRFAVDELCSDKDTEDTGEIMENALEILNPGREIDGEFLSGHAAAREYYTANIAVVEQRAIIEDAPEGDFRDSDMWAEYLARKESPQPPGVQFGISAIDDVTNGIQPGEFGLLVAYTNEGKSHLLAQTLWHAAVHQKRNVFFATSETSMETTKRRIAARHSREPKFGYPQGLNAKAIQNGTLTPEQEEVYRAVTADLRNNMGGEYGVLHVSQMPRGATLNFIDQRVTRFNRIHPLDLVGVDYLQLLNSQRVYGSEREAYNEILRNSKVWATAFDGGRGLALLSPWQVRQTDYKTALQTSGYTLASLADTSEAEKTPDLIISLLRPAPTAQEAVMQVLKNRDGSTMGSSPVHLDYRCSYIGSEPTTLSDTSLGNSTDEFDFAGLLAS